MDSVGGAGAASRPGRLPHGMSGGRADSADSGQVADKVGLARLADEEPRSAATLMEEAQRVANFGSWEWRLEDDAVTWSEQLYRILGLDPHSFQATFDAYIDRVHPADREHVLATVERSLTERAAYRFEHRALRPDGEERAIRCQGEPLIDREGNVVRVVGVCQDVTELVRSERARVEADVRFRSAFENAPIGIALVRFESGAEPRVTEVNRALCEITERTGDQLIGASLTSLCHPEDADEDLVLRERLLAGEIDRYTTEKRCVHEDGRQGWVQLNVSLLPEEAEAARAGIVQVQDVTERRDSEDQLRYLADHDSLTGLYTRRRFREELDSQLALKRRYGGEGALLLLDVDRLKAVNDTHGHAVGDSVLRRVADTLSKRVRSTDCVGRLAGDEFAVLLPNASAAEADGLADALVTRLSEEHVGGWAISVSIGIARFGDGDGDVNAEGVMAAADAAMYEAKQQGGALSWRAGPSFAGSAAQADPVGAAPAVEHDVARRPRFTQEGAQAQGVRSALAHDELLLYGQPVIDLRSGGVAHREVLVRMRDQHGAVLAASEFLGAAARDHGLCGEIDRWVVNHALAHLANGGGGTRLQVNLSGETLGDERALGELLADVEGSGVAPGSLAFEVGEGSIRRDGAQGESILRRIAEAGLPLVLDGFSAGFGSFEYLQRLPLEQIKIDGTVVRSLAGEQPDHSTVRAIVRLAGGTETATVAKLVDSDTLIPLLRMHGVDMAQGYQLGEPTPLSA